jgi:hypothetical protein
MRAPAFRARSVFLVLATCAVAVSVVGTAFLAYDRAPPAMAWSARLRAQSVVIGTNTTAALSVADRATDATAPSDPGSAGGSRPSWMTRQSGAQRWLAAPWQVQTRTAVPLAVPPSSTSRHSVGNCTLLIVALALNVHCWLVPPLQSQI